MARRPSLSTVNIPVTSSSSSALLRMKRAVIDTSTEVNSDDFSDSCSRMIVHPFVNANEINATTSRPHINHFSLRPPPHHHQQQHRCFTSTTSLSSKRTVSKKDFDYSVDLVQQRDRESYLCGLLMPYEARKSYFAVRAWNVEVASIKDGSVSRRVGGAQFADESGANLALKVRMQWWREALNQIYSDPTLSPSPLQQPQQQDELLANMASSYFKNPIVRVLDYGVHDKQLTRRFLERLLEARETDLDMRQPASVQDMVEYADNIFASLLYLSLETVNVRDEQADIVAQHAGIGIGLVTALRGARFRLAKGEFSIPQELVPPEFPYHKLYNLNENLGVELDENEQHMLQEAVEQVCGLAYSHLSKAQELQHQVPKAARTCFLPVIPALHHLNKLEKANYNIFDESLLELDHLTVLFSLTRTWMTGVF
jgi:NADH dehydrogenase [ubiquinone] 1 alpha subcomplex assembly factor 6